jgi:predicted transposase
MLDSMKLVANIQLTPDKAQAKSLRDTLERCNAACNEISKRGFEAGNTRQYDMHKLVYADIRRDLGLTAQAAVRCIAKVGDAHTTQKTNGHEGVVRFRKHAAQPYDDRIFRFVADNVVSIWALKGRPKIPFVCGDRQRALQRRDRLPRPILDRLHRRAEQMLDLEPEAGTKFVG